MSEFEIIDYEPEGLGVAVIIKELEGALRFADDEMRHAWDNRDIAGAYLRVAHYVRDAANLAFDLTPSKENAKQTNIFADNAKEMKAEFFAAEKEWDFWFKVHEILELQVKFWKTEQDRDRQGQEAVLEKLDEIWDTTPEEGVDNDDKAD